MTGEFNVKQSRSNSAKDISRSETRRKDGAPTEYVVNFRFACLSG